MSVEFKDYSIQVKDAIEDVARIWLEEAGGEIQTQTQRNTAVVTGKTKGSFQHKVDGSVLECHVGSNYENAMWEEFGTGMYALYGNGRKTPWIWYDDKGKGHYTKGKKPKRMMFKAYQKLKSLLIASARERFGNLS